MKNLKYIIFSLVGVLGFGIIASAAPYYIFQRGILPETNSTYYLGTTTPTLKAWKGLIVDQICFTGSTCETSWPTGGGGSGTVATSSGETANYVPFWTSTGATPATLSGGVSGFQWIDSLSKLIATNASTTAFTSSGLAVIGTDGAHSNEKLFVGGTITSVTPSTVSDLVINDSTGASIQLLGSNTSIQYILFGDNNDNDVGAFSYDHSANKFTWTTNASAAMYLDSSGRLGIGTSTPTWLLNPYSASASQLALSAGAGIAQWAFRNAGGNLYLATTTVAGTATSSPSALSIIGDSGFIGVGTTSPAGILQIDGNTNGQALMALNNTNSGTSAFANFQLRNENSLGSSVRLGILGTAFTSSGNFLQDAGFLSAEANLSNGLTIMTRANAPTRFVNNDVPSATITASGNFDLFGGEINAGTSTTAKNTRISSGQDALGTTGYNGGSGELYSGGDTTSGVGAGTPGDGGTVCVACGGDNNRATGPGGSGGNVTLSAGGSVATSGGSDGITTVGSSNFNNATFKVLGKSGFASSTPSEVLSVNGNIAASLGNSGYIWLYNGSATRGVIQSTFSNFLFGIGATFNGSNWIYNESFVPAAFVQTDGNDGHIKFSTAPSGTAGGTVTFTTRMSILNTGNVGVATATPWRKFSVTGTVALDGLTSSGTGNAVCITTTKDITDAGGGTCTPSSERFKENIKDFKINADGILEQLDVKEWDYKPQYVDGKDTGHGYGPIAEQVEKVDRNLVDYGHDGKPFSLNWNSLIGLLIQGHQDQQQEIDDLKTQIIALNGGQPIESKTNYWPLLGLLGLLGLLPRKRK